MGSIQLTGGGGLTFSAQNLRKILQNMETVLNQPS